MTEIIKETVTANGSTVIPSVKRVTKVEVSNSLTTEYIVYYIFGAIEILLAFRLVLKLAGASLSSGFVSFIYGISGIFVWPFTGIFRKVVAQGGEITSVFEPASLVAISVYAVIAWGIVKLIRISSREPQVN